jgi:hypothetical protein
VRNTACGEGKQEIIFLVLKLPRQCALVLLVEVMHVIGINCLYDVGRAAL